MQALSEEDRRLWMEAMDGREPVGCHIYNLKKEAHMFIQEQMHPHQFKFLLKVQNNFSHLKDSQLRHHLSVTVYSSGRYTAVIS